MTVCIAAICNDKDEYKIVTCTDHRVSSLVGSSDTTRKEHALWHGWRALVSGSESEYLALVRLYNERFHEKENLTATAIDFSIKEPLYLRKRELLEQFSRNRFGIPYEELVKVGKEKFPPEIFYEAMQRAKAIELDAELILCGFVESSAEVYYTGSDGTAKAAADFATIGEGAYLASSVLLRRRQNSWTSLEPTIYNVFEAKKFAESIGSVGERTHIAVHSCDGARALLSLDLDKKLINLYNQYGPKDVPSDLKFDCEYYYKRTKGGDA